MTCQPRRSQIATVVLVVAALSFGSPLFAQGTFRTTTPGSAFSPERTGQVAVENIAGGGRKFRGGDRQLVILSGTIQIPPATSAEPKLQKLVVHFRTIDGPRLLSVELHNGSDVRRRQTNVKGDYVTREVLTPANTANAWEFQSINARAPLVVRLSVEFGGGFEGIADPGEFVLTGVVAEFPRKPLATGETTTDVNRSLPGFPARPARSIVARVAVLRANGEALVKEGLSAGSITEHTEVIQVALSGNRLAVLRANGDALVKEGGLSAGWTTVHTQVEQVALSGNRLAVLRANGDALVKEGGLSAGWTTVHTQVQQVALSGNRLAVLRANGDALVKEGGLSAGWTTVHTQVEQVALSGNRIAVLRANGDALVKEGGLSEGWITVHTQVQQVALSGNRLAVLRANGDALVKEGGLSEGWITEHTQVQQVALSGNRIAVLREDGEALVKEGNLSAGWITEHTDVVQVALSDSP